MTAAHALHCRDCAASPAHAAHHDRLLLVDVDPDELLALIEMAVTWDELDYSQCDVLGPAEWSTSPPGTAGPTRSGPRRRSRWPWTSSDAPTSSRRHGGGGRRRRPSDDVQASENAASARSGWVQLCHRRSRPSRPG